MSTELDALHAAEAALEAAEAALVIAEHPVVVAAPAEPVKSVEIMLGPTHVGNA